MIVRARELNEKRELSCDWWLFGEPVRLYLNSNRTIRNTTTVSTVPVIRYAMHFFRLIPSSLWPNE